MLHVVVVVEGAREGTYSVCRTTPSGLSLHVVVGGVEGVGEGLLCVQKSYFLFNASCGGGGGRGG